MPKALSKCQTKPTQSPREDIKYASRIAKVESEQKQYFDVFHDVPAYKLQKFSNLTVMEFYTHIQLIGKQPFGIWML